MNKLSRAIFYAAVLFALSAATSLAAKEGKSAGGAAEVSGYMVRTARTGNSELGYRQCATCETRWLKITDKTVFLLRQKPVSLEVARIYSTNDAYLKYDANGNLVRLIASAE